MALELVDEHGAEAGDGQGGYHLEDLAQGMSATSARTVTDADIVLFAGVSGDINPVHLNEEYAAATPFKGRIAHGMLTASFISSVLGNKLPGPGTVYVSQNLNFKRPVRSGDTVHAYVTVTGIETAKGKVTLHTVCKVRGRVVLEGEAEVMVPSRAAA